LNGSTLSVLPAAGEDIECTFTNTKDDEDQTGTIIIKKVTIGGDGNTPFSFASPGLAPASFSLKPLSNGMGGAVTRTFANVPAGTYKITETPVAGWVPDLTCTDPSGNTTTSATSANIELDAGETVTCTFTNSKKNDNRMEEETERFINRRVDNLLTYGPGRSRILQRLGEAPPEPVSLKDGPMKLNGATPAATSAPASRTTGMAPMPGLFGSRAPTGSMALGANPFDTGNATDTAHPDVQVESGPSSASTGILSHMAGQLMPLAQDSGSFKFGTSLSEMRAAATAAEEKRQREKMMMAGINFADEPYIRPATALRPGLDVWVEGQIVRYNDDLGGVNRDGDFSIVYVGADYVLAPGILVGALVQVDDTDEDINDPTLKGNIDGTGWMAGPYIGLRLADNLYFDARAAWGQSDNDIDLWDPVLGSRRGSFDTDRWLASATLTGNEYYGAWRFTPQVSVAYGEEDYGTYSTSLQQTVSGGGASIGRVTGTMEVGYRFNGFDGSTIEPHVAISGIWNFDSDDLYVNGILADTDESRARVEGGILITTPSGICVRGAAGYDGIGADDFEAVSGSLWINVPLN
jgi:outer membrane autotransporter protein